MTYIIQTHYDAPKANGRTFCGRSRTAWAKTAAASGVTCNACRKMLNLKPRP